MATFAAVDIGSNSCRLKIASVQMHRLKTLHEDREVTRLGESVFQTGVISPEAMAATIRALKRFHKAVQLHVVDKVRVVATSAMRDARGPSAGKRLHTCWKSHRACLRPALVPIHSDMSARRIKISVTV